MIVVYQRHSVYKNGVEVWNNPHFDNSAGKYTRYHEPLFNLILDSTRDCYIGSWKGNLRTHDIQYSDDPLQSKRFNTVEEAQAAAEEYSKSGNTVLIAEWYEDHSIF